MSNELQFVDTKEEMVRLANEMKAEKLFDHPPVASPEEAQAAFDNLTEEQRKEIMESPAIRIIVYDDRAYTIVCTLNNINDDGWHISICELTPTKEFATASDNAVNFFMDCFFKEWQEVESPRTGLAVRHFTGND